MRIRCVICGRGYDLANHVPSELLLPNGATLDDALATLNRQFPADRPFPESCLVAVAGRHAGTVGKHESTPLSDNDELLLLMPVAGG